MSRVQGGYVVGTWWFRAVLGGPSSTDRAALTGSVSDRSGAMSPLHGQVPRSNLLIIWTIRVMPLACRQSTAG